MNIGSKYTLKNWPTDGNGKPKKKAFFGKYGTLIHSLLTVGKVKELMDRGWKNVELQEKRN